jgi:hypothetical protein
VSLESGARGLGTGHLVALGGAVAAIGSLWAPWYRFNIASVLPTVNAEADRVLSPSAAQQFHSVASVLPPSFTFDAWTIFHRTDIAIAGLAALVALIVFAAAGALGDGVRVDHRTAGRACASLGLICTGLVAWQLTKHVNTAAGVPSSAISTQWGAYLCLVAAAGMLVGGLMAQASPQRADDGWVPGAPDRSNPHGAFPSDVT